MDFTKFVPKSKTKVMKNGKFSKMFSFFKKVNSNDFEDKNERNLVLIVTQKKRKEKYFSRLKIASQR